MRFENLRRKKKILRECVREVYEEDLLVQGVLSELFADSGLFESPERDSREQERHTVDLKKTDTHE